MSGEIGTGITVGFGTTTTFAPRIMGVIFSAISRPVIPDHHMGSSHMDKVPGKVEDWGQIDIEYLQDQDDIEGTGGVPITVDPEEVTFTWPLKSGQSVAAKLVGQGFVNSFTFPSPFEDRMLGTYTLTWAGKPVHTTGSV
jgi:hypothetical protein